MDPPGWPLRCVEDFEGGDADSVGIIREMRVPTLALRFAQAIVDRYGLLSCKLGATITGNKRKDGVFSGANMDGGRLIEKREGTMSKANGINAKTAIEKDSENEPCPDEAERETQYTQMERTQ
jgi:hypothetical protein